jgi:hypothetical protein
VNNNQQNASGLLLFVIATATFLSRSGVGEKKQAKIALRENALTGVPNSFTDWGNLNAPARLFGGRWTMDDRP